MNHRYLIKVKSTNCDWKFLHLSLHPSVSVTESLLFNKIDFSSSLFSVSTFEENFSLSESCGYKLNHQMVE